MNPGRRVLGPQKIQTPQQRSAHEIIGFRRRYSRDIAHCRVQQQPTTDWPLPQELEDGIHLSDKWVTSNSLPDTPDSVLYDRGDNKSRFRRCNVYLREPLWEAAIAAQDNCRSFANGRRTTDYLIRRSAGAERRLSKSSSYPG